MSRLSETGLFCKMLLSAKGEVFYIGVWLLPQTAMSFILETYNLKKVSFFFFHFMPKSVYWDVYTLQILFLKCLSALAVAIIIIMKNS